VFQRLKRLLSCVSIRVELLSSGEEPAVSDQEAVKAAETPEMPIEFVDLSETRARNRLLLKAARRVFGETAYSISTPRDADMPSRLMDRDGDLVAFCWVDENGKPEFKPWCPHCTN